MDRMDTLTELCEYLKNWFDDGCAVHSGKITIAGGTISCSCDFLNYQQVQLEAGQCFRVAGHPFYDGVHMYPDEDIQDCTFDGSITPMHVPRVIFALVDEIQAWRDKYEALDSTAMSPYTSESFAGYSYSKGGAGASAGNGAGGWQSVFKNRLTHWRKI